MIDAVYTIDMPLTVEHIITLYSNYRITFHFFKSNLIIPLFGHVLGCGECVARSAVLVGTLGLAATLLAIGSARGRAQGRESASA